MVMTDFTKKANEIMARIEMTVDKTMAGEIADRVKTAISEETFLTVYPVYTPTLYKRRQTHGGIADTNEYEAIMDEATHTLTVSDNRSEADVVERGVGYTWEESKIYAMQPFPRPYFANAQARLVASGELDAIVQKALNSIDFH